MSSFSELLYTPPELVQTHGRFCCPANTEHSKYLTSYELFKYHIVNCRELRALREVFICKFCIQLFKSQSKRDEHQLSCSCRMENCNEVFEMPGKLKNKYALNQLVFEDYNEVEDIVNHFPKIQPISAEYNSPEFSDNEIQNDFSQDLSDLKLEQCKNNEQKFVHGCCEKENQLENDREQLQDLGEEEDLTELGQLRQIYQKNILLQQESQQQQVQDQEQVLQQQENTIQREKDQIDEPINADPKESQLIIEEPYDTRSYDNNSNYNHQNPKHTLSLKKVNLIFSSKQKYSEQEQNDEEQDQINLQDNQNNDQDLIPNDGSLFQMDEEKEVGYTENNDNFEEQWVQKSNEIQLDYANQGEETDLERMQHQLGLLRVDNDQRKVSEDGGNNTAISREDQKKPSQKGSSRQLQGRQVKIEEPNVFELNQEEINHNSDDNNINISLQQPLNGSQSQENPLSIGSTDQKQEQNADQSSKIKEENQEDGEFEEPLIDLELIDSIVQKVIEVRVVELMQSVTLRFKDPHLNPITNQMLLSLHRKGFMKVDSSLVFIRLTETKDEKVLDSFDILSCNGQNEIVYFKNFLQHLKSPTEQLLFLSHNVPSICDFFSRNSLQILPETLQKSEQIFVITVELKQQPKYNFDEINSESILISVRQYVGLCVWDKKQQQKVFHLSEQELTEDYLKNIVEIYDPFSQENIILDSLYSRELQSLSIEREQSMQHLLDKRERLCENKGQEQENELFRLKQESILERQINLKKTETQRITQAGVQIEQEIKQLLQQVTKFKAGLSSEIEKGYQRAKAQSDEIYEKQIASHQADFLLLAKENTSEKVEYLNQLKAQHKILIKEQLDVIYEQRKIGNLMLAYHSEEAELKRIVELKDRQISMHKSQQQTSYLCVICKKYPQNCHQKPCGHVLCCFYCVSKENDSKGTIFCKLCKIEIIKFSEIKYKVG